MRAAIAILLTVGTTMSAAQEPKKDDPQTTRDVEVLEAVFADLLAGGAKVLFNDKQILFSLEPPEYPDQVKVSDVIHEPQLKERWKPSAEQWSQAREAALEVVRRQKDKAPFKGYKPKDKRVIIWDKPPGSPDPAQPGLLRAQVFRVFAPGYSSRSSPGSPKEPQFAVIYVTYPADIHAGFGSYGLAKKNGKWAVVFRDLWSTL